MEIRTIPELLQVLLDNEHLFDSGLCNYIYNLNLIHLITNNEKQMLLCFFANNLPERKYYGPSKGSMPMYSFPIFKWPPRKEWLEKQIESFKNIES